MFEKAKWIWGRKNCGVNEYNDFIAEFDCEDTPRFAVLNICADTNYVAYLNGNLVDFGQYHDFPSYKVYDGLDLLSHIVLGKNRLCIVGYSHNASTQSFIKAVPSVIFEVVLNGIIVAVSGIQTQSRLSKDYFSGEIYKFSRQLGYSVKYSANLADNWLVQNTSGFHNSIIVKRDGDFAPRPILKLSCGKCEKAKLITQGVFKICKNEKNAAYAMQNSFMSQRELYTISNQKDKIYFPLVDYKGIEFSSSEGGIYLLFDLQRECAGLLQLEIKAKKGTAVAVGFGEHLDDLRVRTMIEDRCFCLEVICGDGITKFVSYTKRLGCRYLQLFVNASEFVLYNCSLISTDYPIKIVPYDGLDFLQTKIYQTSLRTLQLCMHEHYEDCPWREQALYTFDSRNQILCGYEAFEEYAMPRASLLLMGRSLREDGHLEMCSPCRMALTIPMFTLAFILEVYEYLQQTNDTDFLAEMFPVCEKILITYLSKITDGGIPAFKEPQYWNFYEWKEGLDGLPLEREQNLPLRYDAILNAFMIIALNRFQKITKQYAMASCVTLIDEKIDNLKAFCNAKLFDADKQLYKSYYLNSEVHYSEFANYLMIYAGVSNSVQSENIISELLKKPEYVIKSTISPMIYKYDVLLAVNEKKYLPYVLKDIESVWGEMLFCGATTFWETQKGGDDFYYAGSLCHGWSAIPAYIYQKYIIKKNKKFKNKLG